MKEKYKITAERLNKILKTRCELFFVKNKKHNPNKSYVNSSTINLLNSTITVINNNEMNKSSINTLPILTKKEARIQKLKNTLSNVSTSTNFSILKSNSQIPSKREKYNSPLNVSLNKFVHADKMTIESNMATISTVRKGLYDDFKKSPSNKQGDIFQDVKSERLADKFNLSNIGNENHLKKVVYESNKFPKRKINLKKETNYETFQTPQKLKLSYFNHFNGKIGLIDCIKINQFNKSVSHSFKIDKKS